jgi:hypothetical protein
MTSTLSLGCKRMIVCAFDPVLSIGSPRGFVILSAEPHADSTTGARADEYCRELGNYLNYTRHFFRYGEAAEGARSDWWTRALGFVHRLVYGPPLQTSVPVDELWRWTNHCDDIGDKELWHWADECDSIGGWELFPLWSPQDGFSGRAAKPTQYDGWPAKCVEASVRAMLCLRPRILFVGSSQGHRLITQILPPDRIQCSGLIGRRKFTAYRLRDAASGDETLVFAVSQQPFSGR